MASSLPDNRCVPCRGGTPPLTPEQIQPLLAQLDGWQVEDDKKLIKSFKAKNWVDAVEFVNRITPIAEAENHHPDLYVRWGQVRVYLWTHKIDGLTESDFYMAAKIDRAFGQTPSRTPQTLASHSSAARVGRRARTLPTGGMVTND